MLPAIRTHFSSVHFGKGSCSNSHGGGVRATEEGGVGGSGEAGVELGEGGKMISQGPIKTL